MTRAAIELRKTVNREPILYTAMQFSGGEIQVRLPDPSPLYSGGITITARLTTPTSVMELLLVTDALRRQYGWALQLDLICPYLPYARQDRVCAPGEALSLKVMCDLINGMNFDSVEVWDPHSDVAMALLERAHAVGQETFVSRLTLGSGTLLVAPDAGAAKKIRAVSVATGLGYIQARKVRDPLTGEISGTEIQWDRVSNYDVDLLIVDDICDGGRTFTELAKVLRTVTEGRILLFVTHGIFSQGLSVFDGLIDHVFTANAFPGVGAHPLLTEV